MEKPLPVAQVAKMSGISESTLRSWIRQKKLRAYKPQEFKNGWRIHLADVNRMKELRPLETSDTPEPAATK